MGMAIDQRGFCLDGRGTLRMEWIMESEQTRRTVLQRIGLKGIRREAGREPDEPLQPDDWEASWRYHGNKSNRLWKAFLLSMPSSPRCGICGAPFAGVGSKVVGPLGFHPSRKNPNVCATCVELSPPGGMTMKTGVLFADLRGFTASSDGKDPEEVSKLLRRFYRCAEDVLFPDAIIDKLIGDEVMALYLPNLTNDRGSDGIPTLMLEHARALLRSVGYGSGEKPFVEMGIGLDFGEAFVGNIGQRALFDFTAVGDVVNTASRLQGQAMGGEIVLSGRVAEVLANPIGKREELTLKGMDELQTAYRVSL
jgi:adenylate cyclase